MCAAFQAWCFLCFHPFKPIVSIRARIILLSLDVTNFSAHVLFVHVDFFSFSAFEPAVLLSPLALAPASFCRLFSYKPNVCCARMCCSEISFHMMRS